MRIFIYGILRFWFLIISACHEGSTPKTNMDIHSPKNVYDLVQILNELFPSSLFCSIRHSYGFWTPRLLAMVAVLWMICGDSGIVIAFQSAFDILSTALPDLVKSTASYQGFIGQLAKYQSQLMMVILPHLRDLSKSKLKKYWRIGKWIVIAADGSRENVARNKNRQHNRGGL